MFGGFFLRFFNLELMKNFFIKKNKTKSPVVVHVHPWELDPDTPQVEGLSLLQRFRTYGSTSTLGAKLSRLIDEFEFTCMVDYISFTTRNKIGFERQ